MRPESSLTIPFVRSLAVCYQFHCLHDQQRVHDRFLSQATHFGKVIVLSCRPEQVQPAGSCDRSVEANARDCVTGIDPGLVDSEFVLCLCIVMKGNACAKGKRHQPECASGRNTQRTRPNASLIVGKVLRHCPTCARPQITG